ncbi:MAG: hypothetical protein ACKPJD_21200 [Planctomycetaceae bacterium]
MMGTTTLAFHSQDYPEDRRELIILDDAGELQNDACGGWQIISFRDDSGHCLKSSTPSPVWPKATFWSFGKTTTSGCRTTSARMCERWKGGFGRSHHSCSAVTPDVWSRRTPLVASTPVWLSAVRSSTASVADL